MLQTLRRGVAASAVLAVMALGACSEQPAPPAAEAPAAAPAQPQTASPSSPAPAPTVSQAPAETPRTVGGDGSEIKLSALGEADLTATPLDGELACAFSVDQGRTLLLAKGDVGSRDPAFGAVKVGDYLERVAAPGGFDGMLKGATFNGQGKTIRIALTGPAQGGGESPPRPATLTYLRADGASLTLPGLWTCGP